MNNTQKGLQNIIQAINNIVEPKVESLKYDKTFRGKIIEVIDVGKYKVQINGKDYTMTHNEKLAVGDIVKVKAPLNNFSDIYIESTPGSGSGVTTNYDDLSNKPILNTNINTSLEPNNEEIIKDTIKLHKVSKTGSYNDLLNKPELNFIPNNNIGKPNGVAGLDNNSKLSIDNLPIATKNTVGAVKVGNNISVEEDGTIKAMVIDSLDSDSTTSSLSAKQGKVLEGYIKDNDADITLIQKDVIAIEDNMIENVKVNGVLQTKENKVVNITLDIPTKTSQLENDGGNGTSKYVEQKELGTAASKNTGTISGTIPIINSSNKIEKSLIPDLDYATTTKAGIIKVGKNLNITDSGVLNAVADIQVENVNYIVDTVADLKALTNLKLNDIVQTLGFHSKNDCGGSYYLISASTSYTANEYDIIAITSNSSLVAVLQPIEGTIQPEQFGCYGNNSNNDTQAFQKAAEYAETNSLIFLAKNRYLLNTVTLNDIKNIRIDGVINLAQSSDILYILENFNIITRGTNIYINKVNTGEIQMKGLNSAHIEIINAKTLNLVADDTTNHGALAYNTFELGFVRNIILQNTVSGSYWINENLFLSGRFLNLTVKGDYPHQDNLFLKPMCEHSTITFESGMRNRLIDARLEGNCTITFGEGTYANIINTNYGGFNSTMQPNWSIPSSVTVTDNSHGRNRFYKNTDLQQFKCFGLNVANNPQNRATTTDGTKIKTTGDSYLRTTAPIAVPNTIINFTFRLVDNKNVQCGLIPLDKNFNTFSSDPGILLNSPGMVWGIGKYRNTTYDRNDYWIIIDPTLNPDVKYFQLRLTSNGAQEIEAVDCWLTCYETPNNLNYLLDMLNNSVS